MNPSNQAFVKAFSRRHQTDTSSQAAPQAAPADPNVANSPPMLSPTADYATSPAEATAARDEAIARVDPAQDQIQKPFVAAVDSPVAATVMVGDVPLDERLASLQQVHTAYASGSVHYQDQPSVVPDQAPGSPIVTPKPADEPERPIIETRIDAPATTAPTPKPGVAGNRFETVAEPPNHSTPAPSIAPTESTELAFDETTATAESDHVAATAESFRAAWEVDVFDLPNTVADLFFEGQLFQHIAERLLDAVTAGLSSMLVTSVEQGEGRSSVAIGMAMAGAAAGLRVALVDGDLNGPTLCDDLRLELDQGWIDSVRGGLPLKEVAVHAIEDGVTLIPLMPATSLRELASAVDLAELLDLLHQRFDLVIVDGPAATGSDIAQLGAAFDSAVIVRDQQRSSAVAINQLADRLAGAGVRGVGLVENFS